MGNLNSIHNMCYRKNNNDNNDNKCILCWENITKDKLIKCTRCNSQLHDYCKHNYDKENNIIDYCKCPNCLRVGTLGIDLYYKCNKYKNDKTDIENQLTNL